MLLQIVIVGLEEIPRSDVDSEFDLEPEKGKWIIDAEPIFTIATTKFQPEESKEHEEEQRLFHLQMWVKGTPIHFIVDIVARRT
jgi:hypothetical protein